MYPLLRKHPFFTIYGSTTASSTALGTAPVTAAARTAPDSIDVGSIGVAFRSAALGTAATENNAASSTGAAWNYPGTALVTATAFSAFAGNTSAPGTARNYAPETGSTADGDAGSTDTGNYVSETAFYAWLAWFCQWFNCLFK